MNSSHLLRPFVYLALAYSETNLTARLKRRKSVLNFANHPESSGQSPPSLVGPDPTKD
jgi:hypothetical protein